MKHWGIIGGTGAVELLERQQERIVETPWGAPSCPPAQVDLGGVPVWFLARHGNPHRIAPHRVNYRANIAALKQVGVTDLIAINAVGGVDPGLAPGDLVVPDQLIDYTWGRESTFANDADRPLVHLEFGRPFSAPLREALLEAASGLGLAVHESGCCAVTQGPRLETEAEVRRLARDGATLVGMTTMPEAILAREAGLNYASLCVVANPAAGVTDEAISLEEIDRVLHQAMGSVRQIIESVCSMSD
jgi:5'-deoxy-5'-methylthioadenosine phosphorylase